MIPLWVSVCLLAASEAPDDVIIEKILGDELPIKYKHPASIAQLVNGDFLLVFFGGSGEYQPDTRVHLSRQRRGETTWSPPLPITAQPEYPEGNPVVWQAPDGKVWLFNVSRWGKTWSTSRSQARFSTDGGQTWSKPEYLSREAGTMVRGQPIVLANGDYLLPAYHETGHDTEMVGPDTTSFFFRYDVKGDNWSETNRIRSRIGNLQPAPALVTDRHLICYCRRGGDYSARADGRIVRAESHDGGRTWSDGFDTEFPNPNAAVELLRLRNGHLLLFYNDSLGSRTPLTAALSTDGGKSFPHRRDLVRGPGDFGYPFAVQAQDGKIHLIFTSHKRTVVNRAIFDESAVLGHTKL